MMALPRLWFRTVGAVGWLLMLAGVLAWLVGTPLLLTHASCGHLPSRRDLVACGIGGPLSVALGMVLVRRPRGVLVWSVLALATMVGLALAGVVPPEGTAVTAADFCR